MAGAGRGGAPGSPLARPGHARDGRAAARCEVRVGHLAGHADRQRHVGEVDVGPRVGPVGVAAGAGAPAVSALRTPSSLAAATPPRAKPPDPGAAATASATASRDASPSSNARGSAGGVIARADRDVRDTLSAALRLAK